MGNEVSSQVGRLCSFAKLTRIQKFRGSANGVRTNHIKSNCFQGIVPGQDGETSNTEGHPLTEDEDAAGEADHRGPEPEQPEPPEPQLPSAPEHVAPSRSGSRSGFRLEDGETKKLRNNTRTSMTVSSDPTGENSAGIAEHAPPRTSDRQATVARPLKTDMSDRAKTGAVGLPFPKRPIACKLSAKTWAKLEELFRLMDQDHSNAVTKEEARAFFKGAFSNLSADAMFNEVDVDGSGAITAEEFVNFWMQVRSSGYKEQDILDEIGELIEGGAWVDWKDGRDTVAHEVKFPKRPMLCRLSAKSWKRCEELFHTISGSEREMSITRERAQQFFKGSFSKISADAMFNEIDTKHHGIITPQEFMAFWVQVRSSGYKEKDILEEIDNLMEGNPWVDWKDGRQT